MARLPEDFPGFAALDAAGEATSAKLRKRIAAGTLREIDGIGEAREKEIIAAFEKLDTPADQAKDIAEVEDDASITPASQAKELHAPDTGETSAPEAGKTEGTILNQGNAPAAELGAAEAAKPSAEKNELVNHALDELTPAERERANVRESVAERIAHSGAVFIHDPAGPYASAQAVRIPQGAVRIKVDPIGFISPQKGMTVRDGEDEYAIQEDLGPDSKGDDWLKVRSPNTGQPFIK